MDFEVQVRILSSTKEGIPGDFHEFPVNIETLRQDLIKNNFLKNSLFRNKNEIKSMELTLGLNHKLVN